MKIFKSLNKTFDLLGYYNEIKHIPKYFESHQEVFNAQTNLHILILSYSYSFFDKSGIDIRKLREFESLSEETKGVLDQLSDL